MKKLMWVLVAVLLGIVAAGGYFYVKNERAAQAAAQKALSEFKAQGSYASWSRSAEETQLLERVRTLDEDGAEPIRKACLAYQDPAAKKKIESTSIAPSDVPEIALLESAGASRTCSLTGGVVPIPDNPYETKIIAGNQLMTLGHIMVEKSKALETQGLPDEAEKELLMLLSVGAHLEDDAHWASLIVGSKMQRIALDALTELYAARGDDGAGPAARLASFDSSFSKRFESSSKLPPFVNMSLSSEGLHELAKIVENPSLLRALRAEALLALSAGHLFHLNRIVLGPGSERRAIVEGLKIDDPVLADLASKARKALLELPFAERRESVSTIYVLK